MTSASHRKLRVAVVGCGHISDIYLTNLPKFAGVEVCAVADLDMERVRVSALRHGVARVLAADAVYADADIDLILNHGFLAAATRRQTVSIDSALTARTYVGAAPDDGKREIHTCLKTT